MKSSLLLLNVLLIAFHATCQSTAGFEHLCYLKGREILHVPIARLQNRKQWYSEARYNYEAPETASIYAGKEFSKKGKLSCTATPMAGTLLGKWNGGSAALNISMDYQNFQFLAQSQYTLITREEEAENFFYSWSELRYYHNEIFFAGLTVQQTLVSKKSKLIEPGIVAGFSFGRWTFPIYLFNLSGSNRYLVLAINWELENK